MPLVIVALLWLSGRGPFHSRVPTAPSPVVGVRTRQVLSARAPAVLDDDSNDDMNELDRDGDGLGDEPWLCDPYGLQPVLPRECPIRGDCVIDFSYRDELLLEDIHTNGGRVWIPAAARARGGKIPLVVLLHGTDGDEQPDPPHRLLAPPLDLSLEFKRAVDRGVSVPVLVAAPSQSRDAQSSPTLWTEEGFDLADFVTVLDAELKALGSVRVDHQAVSVLGHSGAGCVVTPRKINGLFNVAENLGTLRKQGIVVPFLGLMDICFYGYGGGHFLRDALAGFSTRVVAMWVEPETWFTTLDRDLDGFAKGLGVADPVRCNAARFESCLGNDRGWWLFKARRHGLEQGPVNPPDDGHLSVHSALTRWFVQEILRRHFSGKTGP